MNAANMRQILAKCWGAVLSAFWVWSYFILTTTPGGELYIYPYSLDK